MSESLVHLPQLVATPRERPKVLSLGQGAEDRNHDCDFYDDCLDEAVKRGWASWDCAECGRRDVGSGRTKAELAELAVSRAGSGAPVPQMAARRGADEPSPTRAKELRAQLVVDQEQQRRDTADRIRAENWQLKAAAFWAPETVEVLAQELPCLPAKPGRPWREGPLPESELAAKRAHLAEIEAKLKAASDEKIARATAAVGAAVAAGAVRSPVAQVAALVGEAVSVARGAEILSRSFTRSRPPRPAPSRSPVPRQPATDLPRGQLPTLKEAVAAVELADREAARAKDRLRLVVAELDQALAPARAALGTVFTSTEPLVVSPAAFALKPRTIAERIEVALEDGNVRLVPDLAAVLGESRAAVSCALGRLFKEGLVIKAGRGAYATSGLRPPAKPERGQRPSQKGTKVTKGAVVPGSASEMILELLKGEVKGKHVPELAAQAKCSIGAAQTAVRRLVQSGKLKRLARGVYVLAGPR